MATKKTAKPKKEKLLEIGRVMSAIDTKNYEFYNNLTPEEQKEFSPYPLLRSVSNTTSKNRDLQEWYIEMTNEMVNKNFFELSHKHPGLMYKLYATVGTGGTTFHGYLPSLKYKFDKFEKLLGEIYPAMKADEIKMLASMMDKNDREELFDSMGFDKKQRKEYE